MGLSERVKTLKVAFCAKFAEICSLFCSSCRSPLQICKEVRKISSISDSSNVVTSPSCVTCMLIFLHENCRNNQICTQYAKLVTCSKFASGFCALCTQPSALALFTHRKRGGIRSAKCANLQFEHQNLQISLQSWKHSCKIA